MYHMSCASRTKPYHIALAFRSAMRQWGEAASRPAFLPCFFFFLAGFCADAAPSWSARAVPHANYCHCTHSSNSSNYYYHNDDYIRQLIARGSQFADPYISRACPVRFWSHSGRRKTSGAPIVSCHPFASLLHPCAICLRLCLIFVLSYYFSARSGGQGS